MSKPVSGLKILDRLRAGSEVWSWDVHHTALASLIRKGMVVCATDCQVVLAECATARTPFASLTVPCPPYDFGRRAADS